MEEKCFCHFNGYEVKDAKAREHIENKTNPHGVTAEQVGARANTWLPTPFEIKVPTKKIASIPAGGSVDFNLEPKGLYLISVSDNQRTGCVIVQTGNGGVLAKQASIIELTRWAYSSEGLKLTISETGGQYSVDACVIDLGYGYL